MISLIKIQIKNAVGGKLGENWRISVHGELIEPAVVPCRSLWSPPQFQQKYFRRFHRSRKFATGPPRTQVGPRRSGVSYREKYIASLSNFTLFYNSGRQKRVSIVI